ncbi:MAG: alpha/beta hydrolase [Lachnospiraceae bacterium]|nr:alpha/beta hydrolase [Lachnospiraceae bacterium]
MNGVPQRVIDTRNAWAAGDAKRDAGLVEPDDIKKIRNISYGPHGDWNLMDLYLPDNGKKAGAEGKGFPVIVDIHGGGYFYGDKELYRFYTMHLARSGFAVINFNYRLAPENSFPAPLEDTYAVFLWISENYEKYGLDPSCVFLTGDSAGAQLSSQFAVICSNREYAELFGFNIPENICLKGVSLACGMYDFRARLKRPGGKEMALDYLKDEKLFTDPRTDVLSYITSDYPPAFVFTAWNDFLFDACEPFVKLLKEKGVRAEGRIYGSKEEKEIAHVFHCNMRLPEGERANRDQIAFLESCM